MPCWGHVEPMHVAMHENEHPFVGVPIADAVEIVGDHVAQYHWHQSLLPVGQ